MSGRTKPKYTNGRNWNRVFKTISASSIPIKYLTTAFKENGLTRSGNEKKSESESRNDYNLKQHMENWNHDILINSGEHFDVYSRTLDGEYSNEIKIT